MSMEERPRERKEVKKEKNEDLDSINDWLDNTKVEDEDIKEATKTSIEEKEIIADTEKTVSKHSIQPEVLETDIVKEAAVDVFIIKLPSWVKKPWMYVKPSHVQQQSSWLDSWKGVVLEYSRSYKIHIVNLSQLNTIYPFKNLDIGKTLTYDQLQSILDLMVNEGLAKWIDEAKISARIYYLTNKEWASKIMNYMVETGYAAEVMTFYELQQLNQEWSTLPRNELQDIFEILVTEGRAKWVGKGKDTLSFIL